MIQLGNNPLEGAACKTISDEQKEWFFAEGQAGTPLIRKAKAICEHECPIKDKCLQWALKNEVPGYRYGVYGGMSARERDKKFKSYNTDNNLCRNGLHDMTDPANHAVREDGVRCKACKLAVAPKPVDITGPNIRFGVDLYDGSRRPRSMELAAL